MSYFKNLEEEQSRLNLKSEKVELSIFLDYIKELDKIGTKTLNKSEEDLEQIKKIVTRNISNLKKLKSKSDNIHKAYMKDGDRVSKELDIAPAQIPDFKKLDKLYFYIDKLISNMLQEYKKLS